MNVGDFSRSPISKAGTTMLGANPGDIYSDAGPGSSLDLDTDRPLFNEESYRPGAPGNTIIIIIIISLLQSTDV